MSDSEFPELVGKIISLKYHGSGTERNYAYIQVDGFELQAGRKFLVGKTIATPSGMEDGIRFCVAWEIVTAYYEFDSMEHCQKCINNWLPEKKSRFRFLRK
jgi:hypothetical protein